MSSLLQKLPKVDTTKKHGEIRTHDLPRVISKNIVQSSQKSSSKSAIFQIKTNENGPKSSLKSYIFQVKNNDNCRKSSLKTYIFQVKINETSQKFFLKILCISAKNG